MKEITRSAIKATVISLLSLVSQAPVAADTPEFGQHPIKYGTKGDAVLKLRCLLKAHGFIASKNPSSDYYDGSLVWAVKQFQKSVRLKQPGNAGPATLAELKRNTAAWNKCVTKSSARSEPQSNEAKPAKKARLGQSEVDCRPADTAMHGDFEYSFSRVIKIQILLDRQHFSTGELDGICGSNTRKAIFDWRRFGNKISFDPMDEASIDRALARNGGTAFKEHRITADDVAGPFLASIPSDWTEKSKLETMGYTSKLEKLGERFQTSTRALEQLNPDARFVAGEVITIPRLGQPLQKTEDNYSLELQIKREVVLLHVEGAIVARFPVTINPAKTPTRPMVTGVRAHRPNYTHTTFVNGTKKVFVYPEGPNNPVGTDWITLNGLAESDRHLRGFGLHGSSDPSRISKQSSAGCIRLTNWDIEELAPLLKQGVVLVPTT